MANVDEEVVGDESAHELNFHEAEMAAEPTEANYDESFAADDVASPGAQPEEPETPGGGGVDEPLSPGADQPDSLGAMAQAFAQDEHTEEPESPGAQAESYADDLEPESPGAPGYEPGPSAARSDSGLQLPPEQASTVVAAAAATTAMAAMALNSSPSPPPSVASTKPIVSQGVPQGSRTNYQPVAQPPPRAHPSPTRNNSQVSSNSKLTFTGAPHVARAKPYVRPDFSHSTFEVQKIHADNIKLCNRLVEISKAPPSSQHISTTSVGSAPPGARLAPANIAPSAVNRNKKEDAIAAENLALFKRLQAVKPSKELNRGALAKDFKSAQAYGTNARKFKPVPAWDDSTAH